MVTQRLPVVGSHTILIGTHACEGILVGGVAGVQILHSSIHCGQQGPISQWRLTNWNPPHLLLKRHMDSRLASVAVAGSASSTGKADVSWCVLATLIE